MNSTQFATTPNSQLNHRRRLLFAGLLCCVPALQARAAAPQALVDAARTQIGVTRIYDGAYQTLSYPGGDVPLERGVCTDVLVRAYRTLGADLQVLVHEDMRAHWRAYAAQAKRWGMTAPNSHIDHRRVPNLAIFFGRHGKAFIPTKDAARYQAGDVVAWKLRSGLPHIGIVTNKRTLFGTPLIIHNIGAGTREENELFSYDITGHFRYHPSTLSAGSA